MALKREDVEEVADEPFFAGPGPFFGGAPAFIDRRDLVRQPISGSPGVTAVRTGRTQPLLDIFLERRSPVVQRAPIVPAVVPPRVRRSPTPRPAGVGLLPPQTLLPTPGVPMGTFVEDILPLIQPFFPFDPAISPAVPAQPAQPGTVVEFPTQPGMATCKALGFVKKRKRRRRLLTASDKCDIAAMKNMLSSSEFKSWLTCVNFGRR